MSQPAAREDDTFRTTGRIFFAAVDMYPDTEITGGRFLGFNGGDWFMMLGGLTLAGFLVWFT